MPSSCLYIGARSPKFHPYGVALPSIHTFSVLMRLTLTVISSRSAVTVYRPSSLT